MTTAKVFLDKISGKIKPMNAANNGPAGSRIRQTGNFKDYASLNIPYARLHDSSFYAGNYGGEFAVDVHRIFPDFSKDENEPSSYIFEPTDGYLQDIESAGTKVFYRLGASIEHGYKRGTYPPADFAKWARICEHIILHYTQGWANGYHMDIEYWEIWNEPDCRNRNGENPCWQGTEEQFYDFYEVVAKYLKTKFPSLKIGGPAFCSSKSHMAEPFLSEMQKRNVPIDFYSFHRYSNVIENYVEVVEIADQQRKKYGYENAELHLNEWNYVKGWVGDDYTYSLATQKNLKGSAFVSAVMLAMQKSKLDMLSYYDLRPSGWNGVFEMYTSKPLKPFYTFKAFSEIAKLKNELLSETEDDVYIIASQDGDEACVVVTRYDDNDEADVKDIAIDFSTEKTCKKITIEYYVIDENHNLELVREEYFSSPSFRVYIKMPNFNTYMLKIRKEY